MFFLLDMNKDERLKALEKDYREEIDRIEQQFMFIKKQAETLAKQKNDAKEKFFSELEKEVLALPNRPEGWNFKDWALQYDEESLHLLTHKVTEETSGLPKFLQVILGKD